MLCLVTQSCLTLCNPMDCSPPGFSVHRDSLGKNTGVNCHALPNTGIEPRSPALQRDSLPAEPPENPYIKLKYVNFDIRTQNAERVKI